MRSASALIRDLASQGIELGLGADDQLIIRAPEGAIDSETLEQIRHEKRRVMAVLSQTQPLEPAREKRHQKVADMMAADDKRGKYYFYADTYSEADSVVVCVGIRGLATFDMRVPRPKYDPYLFAKALQDMEDFPQ